ncbi:hypothetical protein [Cryobacterium sp. N22]|uniref:hypothetical protein n=1 Tax=Cryobacterium sp. N22 TaxID=2048290 RepID=UPI0011B0460C|nr:hypothetical protein [Cryobacterium sp. N22]
MTRVMSTGDFGGAPMKPQLVVQEAWPLARETAIDLHLVNVALRAEIYTDSAADVLVLVTRMDGNLVQSFWGDPR